MAVPHSDTQHCARMVFIEAQVPLPMPRVGSQLTPTTSACSPSKM